MSISRTIGAAALIFNKVASYRPHLIIYIMIAYKNIPV